MGCSSSGIAICSSIHLFHTQALKFLGCNVIVVVFNWVVEVKLGAFVGFQGHMMWLQRQDSFKEKFGDLSEAKTNDADN